jgi:hypothetical protein
LRRLSREQYERAARDLLGLTAVPELDIPTDEKVGVFYNNSAAPVDRLAVEQYLDSAARLAAAAVANLPALTSCDRASLGDTACALELVREVGARAYRRPLSDAELGRYEALFAAHSASFESGVEQVLTTMLQSPHFLYQLELSAPGSGLPGPRLLDGFELATRLALTLWGSVPDEGLAAAARDGKLATVADVRIQAERLLSDPRAADVLGSFHLQWLGLDGLDTLGKEAASFPEFDATLRRAMRRETTRFVDYVVRETDGSLGTLLTSPLSFAEGPLAALYGVAPAADALTPIALDPSQRGGLLTQAAFLATHAHPNQTSPVRRGVVVRRNILCSPLSDPPPNVNAAAPEVSADATTRERFAAHTESAACAGCHLLIDPIGFGFENYDAVGRYRPVENGAAVDASGSLRSADGSEHPFVGAVQLSQELAASSEVQRCFARQWFRFALGRFETSADECSLAQMDEAFAASGFNVRSLLLSLVTSDAFRHVSGSSP